MKLYSTKDKSHVVSLKEAIMKGLPPDNGLYMPCSIPHLSQDFIRALQEFSFKEISYHILDKLTGTALPDSAKQDIIERSITFPAKLVNLEPRISVLELFHGPSLAFKDFGARFMSQTMAYYNRGEDKTLHILVATSGDTGGAVAAGFLKTPGISVTILFPKGKVSYLQEKQLTTLGHNIKALEIEGSFDDCQDLVKKAFLDKTLNSKFRLSSANSINIARLIPQSFYYFEAYKQVQHNKAEVAFIVPSGNFGNLTAGIFAQKMGLPIRKFIAATNSNNVVPLYLETGKYEVKPSIRTISNAMDVGNPSNFARMLDLYGSTWNKMKNDILGYYCSEQETKTAIKVVYDKYAYIIDPHGAVGYMAALAYDSLCYEAVILETAHPSKFVHTVEEQIGQPVEIPERLAVLKDKPGSKTTLSTQYDEFRDYLMEEL